MNFPLYGLVLYLPLWHPELSGSPIISKDLNAISCTVTGAVHSPPLGRTFDGTGNVVKTAAAVSVPTAFTALAWWKRSGASGGAVLGFYHTIFAALNGRNDYNGFLVISDGTSCRGDINTSLGNYTSTTVVISAIGWHLIGYVWTGSNLYTLTDGSISAAVATTGTLNSGTTGMRIGRWLDNNNYYLTNGLIGDAWVYNRSLTTLEFQQLYLATKRHYVT